MGIGKAKPRLVGRGFVDTAIETLSNHNPVHSKKQALDTWEVGHRPSASHLPTGRGLLARERNVWQSQI